MAIKTLLCPSCLKPMRARPKAVNTALPTATDTAGPHDTVLDLSISPPSVPLPEPPTDGEPGALQLDGLAPAAQLDGLDDADSTETVADMDVAALMSATSEPPPAPPLPGGSAKKSRAKGSGVISGTSPSRPGPEIPKGIPIGVPPKAKAKAKATSPASKPAPASAKPAPSPEPAPPSRPPASGPAPSADLDAVADDALDVHAISTPGPPPTAADRKATTTSPRLALHTPTRQPRPRTGTAPEVMIAHVRQDITHTGLGSVRGIPTAVVGRAAELRKIMDAYKRVREEGLPQTVVIRGATGNGKTRLVIEFLESLRLSQYPFLLLTNFAGSRTPEQRDHIVQRIVASRFRLNRDLPNSARRKELLSRIRSVFPRESVAEATVAFGHLLGVRFPFSDTLAPLFRRIHEDPAYFDNLVLRLLHQMLQSEARIRPTILWCDNFHDETYEAQQHIAELLPSIADRPVLVLLAVEDSIPEDTFAKARESFTLQPLDVPLSELSRDECAELVHDILRLVEDLPELITELIVEKSRGVPLVVEHMVRMLIDHGVIEQGDVTWTLHTDRLESVPNLPETIEGLARARVANVTPDERFVLQLAALMGSLFRLDDILKIIRFMPFEGEQPWFDNRRESWLREVILELLGRDIIVLAETDDDTETFQFTYPIERSFILESIDPLFAQWAHGCHARILVERGGELDHIAWHFETAGMLGEAAAYWRKLALEQREAGNLTVAIDALHRAVSLTGPQYGASYLDNTLDLSRLLIDSGSFHVAEQFIAQMLQCAYAFQDAPRSVLAYTEHAHALYCLGKLERAHGACQHALDLALRFNETGTVVALAHDRLARITLHQGQAGACSEALRLLDTSLELRRGEEDDPMGLVETLIEMGAVRICRAEMNRALAAFTEALALCRSSNAELSLCRTLAAFANLHCKSHRFDLARRHALEAVSVGGEQLDYLTEFRLRGTLGLIGIAHQDFGEATNSLKRAGELAERGGNSSLLAENSCHWSELYFSMEDFQTAAEHAEQAVIRARSGESQLVLGIALRILAQTQARMLRERIGKLSVRGVRDVFLEALSIVEEMGNWHETASSLVAYGEFLIDRGKRPEGQRCFQRAAKLDPVTTQALRGS